ncbi:glutathione hydrolase 1 proenzyme-like [Pollicipes pollicipes]|uniref:glutathione hydrolase 1 proenzyme-like n=1 Tax=Pollicipes pollicipes TaxID=41117 RepID=UPI001884A62B|nr:glutathione hydrolase 1 proenzyme-like [Pollicipes pollicipes]
MLTITDRTSNAKAVIFILAVAASLAILIIVGVELNGTVKRPAAQLTGAGSAATSDSKLGQYRSAAVCADAGVCASIGRTMLQRGGNAVDAALATLLCDGVANPHSMGIGGGFVMTLYNHSTGLTETLVARERAPAAAAADMFSEKAEAQTGGMSVAVPGEIPGYWAVHQRYGRLPWRALFQPAISLCRYGVPVSHTLQKALQNSRIQTLLHNDSFHLGDIFLKDGNDTMELGDVVRKPTLAATLEKIAEGGLQAYQDLGQKLAEDIQEIGGVVTHDDIKNYMPTWAAPVRVRAQARTLHTIVETFKFAYAQRSRLGDADFVDVDELVRNMTSDEFLASVRRRIRPDGVLGSPGEYGADFAAANDSGTAHISVVDADGSAVSVTSTVNLYLGSGFRSPQTGIILNNEMDDFSSNFTNYFGLPPSENNRIEPGKRPQSSMAPAILVDDDGGVRMVIGASGGTKITSVTGYVAARNLWMGENIKEAVDAMRVHHQLLPDVLKIEKGMPEVLAEQLRLLGHPVEEANHLARVCGIARTPGGRLEANADYRKGGDVAGF